LSGDRAFSIVGSQTSRLLCRYLLQHKVFPTKCDAPVDSVKRAASITGLCFGYHGCRISDPFSASSVSVQNVPRIKQMKHGGAFKFLKQNIQPVQWTLQRK